MSTYSVSFRGDVEMIGDDPRPTLTTLLRPNFVVGDNYCLCYIRETNPIEGIGLHGKGSFKAIAVCDDAAVELFTVGGKFELRVAARVFANGTFRDIYYRTLENEPAKP